MDQVKKGTLSAVVVGAGLMGGWHAAAIRRAGGQVVAVVDPDQGRAVALARRYRGARVFTRLEDALSQIRPVVVHLCTPAIMHRLQAEQALKAGAHLFVEKPIALSLKETQDIFNLAEQNGAIVCPVHQFVFQDGVQRLQAWLPDAGDIFQISFIIRSAGGAGMTPAELSVLAGEILPHPLSVLQALLPGSLESLWSVGRPSPGELRTTAIYYDQNSVGIGLAIEISLNARPTQNSLSIAALGGTFNADLFHGFAVRIPGKVSRTRKIVQPFDISLRQFSAAAGNLFVRLLNGERAYPGLNRLVSLFYQSLRNGEPSPISIQDTLAVAQARQVILAS